MTGQTIPANLEQGARGALYQAAEVWADARKGPMYQVEELNKTNDNLIQAAIEYAEAIGYAKSNE